MIVPPDDTGDPQALIASLRAERDAELAGQAALAEVMELINRSPGDPTPVFDAVLDKAMQLSLAAFGILMTFDGRRFATVAARGLPPAFANFARAEISLEAEHPQSALGQVVSGADVIHEPDITDYAIYRSANGSRRALADLAGARTRLIVALRKDGILLGAINIYRQEVRPFSERQVTLLRNFAAQTVIAMEIARLLNDQREALEQQTATAEVLGVINANPGELAPVFDAMLEKALLLSGSAFGMLSMFDGQCFHAVATRNLPLPLLEASQRGIAPEAGTVLHRLLLGETLVQLRDAKDDDTYRSGQPSRRLIVDVGGARSMVLVALRKNEALLGAFNIFRREVRPFSDKEIALLRNFAAQAVIAMENARLLTEQREALELQTATAEVLQVINASPGDPQPVFNAILAKAHDLCGAAKGALVTYDGDLLRAVATRGISEAFERVLRNPRPRLLNSPLDRLMNGESFFQIANCAADTHPISRAAAEIEGVRTILFVPLRRESALLGFISAYRQELGPFSDKAIAMLGSFAAQAVIAMENARLLSEQREALEHQTATAEILRTINASPGNLAPVFEAILEKAHSLCNSAMGAMAIYHGAHFRAVATRGYTATHDRLIRQPFLPNHYHMALLRGERIAHIHDVREGELEDNPITRSVIENTEMRTCLTVPLRKDGVLLGFISAWRLEVRPFAEKEIALLENFAEQAVVAMDNARLLEEIRQRQAELRTTFENMGDGVAMFDEMPRLVAWNRKFQDILDVSDEALADRPTFADYIRYLTRRGEFGPDGDPEEQVRRLEASRGEPMVFERMRPNGQVIEVRHNPVAGGGFVLIYADITERKRNEEALRTARDAAEVALRELKAAQANLVQAEKMASLGQLTAGIAHEIKNPLNFVNNFSELSVELLDELKGTAAPAFATLDADRRADIDELTATLTSNLQKIAEHGHRADGIVRSMLEHSRGASGERRIVDLNALVEEAMNLAYHGARAQDQSFNIALERDFADGMAPVPLTPQDIMRVLLNLCSNGFYAARKRQAMEGSNFAPSLRVSTFDRGDAVDIRVRDNGIGVPPQIRDKLFQPFFTTKPTGEGTGLGLSISYDIVVKQHGGELTVDSEPGAFTEFTVTLPRVMAAQEGAGA